MDLHNYKRGNMKQNISCMISKIPTISVVHVFNKIPEMGIKPMTFKELVGILNDTTGHYVW